MSEAPAAPPLDAAADPTVARRGQMAKAALAAGLGLGLLVFVAVVIASFNKGHDLGHILTGLFTGLFTGLLVAAAGSWGAMTLLAPKATPAAPDLAKATDLERLLAPTLTELETARVDTVHQVNLRLVSRVPMAMAVAVGLWIFSQFGKNPAGVFNLLEFMGLGAAVGWYWASHKLSDAYARLYKDRVLPKLAAQFGDLSYRQAIEPDMALLRAQHIFREFDRVIADDEIFGTYRGMALNIVELKLTYGSGKQKRTEFDGLLTTVALPRHLAGTTAVIADNGTLGNLEDRFGGEGREHVAVEDPAFEKAYEVYGTDQVGARALLTPAFMERFLALGGRSGFMAPLALAQDNRLTIALPKAGGGNLFEPPNYRQPAASREALLKLYGDIQAVLSAADAVIDLDQFSRGAKPAPAVS
jgi:hypothetical protein